MKKVKVNNLEIAKFSSKKISEADIQRCFKENIPFTLKTPKYVMTYIPDTTGQFGDILSKVEDNKMYIYQTGKGWVET